MQKTTIERSLPQVTDDITQLVGETPILRLKRIVPAGSAEVYAKLEYLNPGGSVKDRAAIGIIRRAEEQGVLKPDGRLVTISSGEPPDDRTRAAFFIVEPNRKQLDEISRLIEAGTFRPIVGSVFPLAEARQAYQQRPVRAKVVLQVITAH